MCVFEREIERNKRIFYIANHSFLGKLLTHGNWADLKSNNYMAIPEHEKILFKTTTPLLPT